MPGVNDVGGCAAPERHLELLVDAWRVGINLQLDLQHSVAADRQLHDGGGWLQKC